MTDCNLIMNMGYNVELAHFYMLVLHSKLYKTNLKWVEEEYLIIQPHNSNYLEIFYIKVNYIHCLLYTRCNREHYSYK